ncbi:hypothetical protein PVA44_01165 [Entomospira nematocerorum]|uniref:Uncharacterized protein n=1 Tax=Entomospira nematocerorum TaxID=2719987 RepID=A0A968GCN7_9SPIO|nr:hypothetical protein [Entomospira nematocera]NIZ47354.1 hypothetical protein [Entomospira nematocera]WDI34105.1 hypothetical protein PVA44_01165 [Entomospira nematocera]
MNKQQKTFTFTSLYTGFIFMSLLGILIGITVSVYRERNVGLKQYAIDQNAIHNYLTQQSQSTLSSITLQDVFKQFPQLYFLRVSNAKTQTTILEATQNANTIWSQLPDDYQPQWWEISFYTQKINQFSITLNDDLHLNVVSVTNLLKHETIMTMTTFALTAVLILLGLSLVTAFFYRLPESKSEQSQVSKKTKQKQATGAIFTQEETTEALAHAEEEWLEEPTILKHEITTEDNLMDAPPLQETNNIPSSFDDINWDVIDNPDKETHESNILLDTEFPIDEDISQGDTVTPDTKEDFHLPEIDVSFFDEENTSKLEISDLDDLELPESMIHAEENLPTDNSLLLAPSEDLEYELSDPQELHFLNEEIPSDISLVENELDNPIAEPDISLHSPMDLEEDNLNTTTLESDLFNDPFEQEALTIIDSPSDSVETDELFLDPQLPLEPTPISTIIEDDLSSLIPDDDNISSVNLPLNKEMLASMDQPPHRESFISHLSQAITQYEEMTVILLQQEDPSSSLFQLLLENHIEKHYPEIVVDVEQTQGRYAILIANKNLSQSLIFIEDLHDLLELQELYFYIGVSSKSARNISANLLYEESLQALEKAISSGERGAMIAFKSNSDKFDTLNEN